MEEHDYALGDMDRRMGNLMRFGTVSAVDTANALVKIDLGDLVTDWVPWTTARAGQDRAWSVPDVGEQVVLLSPGDPSQGVVIGSLFQTAHPANGNAAKDWRITFKDGTVIEHDRDSGALNVQASTGGSIRLNVGSTTLLLQNGQATLTADAITFNGPLTVNGNVATTGTLTNNGKNVGSTHTHSGVTAGPSNTGAPV